MADRVRHGGCNCGKVRFEARGEPRRVGLCHCLTCRKETGAPFNAFAVWPRDAVTVTGTTASWSADADARHFCPTCGSSLFYDEAPSDEIEIRLGTLDDAPTDLEPAYESWTCRRESWQTPVQGAGQHARNRS